MSLNPEQIKLLLTVATNRKRGGRGKGGKTIDTSIRDYSTWFKLAHQILDKEQADIVGCSNPECVDPRIGRTILVANVNDLDMCRYCFLDGYGG